MSQYDWQEVVHDALERMRRASLRKTGCRLTKEMVEALSLTFVGEAWEEQRPDSISQPTMTIDSQNNS